MKKLHYLDIVVLCLLALAVLMPTSARAQGANYTFVDIDFPGATFTYPNAVDDHGQIAGYYLDSSYVIHGFLYDGAQYHMIDYPDGGEATQAWGINNSGIISGQYNSNNQTQAHGFTYNNNNGEFTSFDYPDQICCDTLLRGLNNMGEVVGLYYGCVWLLRQQREPKRDQLSRRLLQHPLWYQR